MSLRVKLLLPLLLAAALLAAWVFLTLQDAPAFAAGGKGALVLAALALLLFAASRVLHSQWTNRVLAPRLSR
jgi:hypothetical protein